MSWGCKLMHHFITAALLSVFFCTLPLLGQQLDQPKAAADNPARIPAASESELPYNQQPINYALAAPTDPIAKLQSHLESNELTLEPQGESGVLADVLSKLKIPVSSQLLVFSKSSAHAKLIQPKTPRAIYFNDDVYVVWVPGSTAIELSAADAVLGGTFYSLSQSDQNDHRIRRDESCLLCHLSRSTLRVPGHVVRSFTTDALGELRTGWSRITHDSPYEKRWAGWYVTGQVGDVKHLGNVFGQSPPTSPPVAAKATSELPALCDTSRYLYSRSDILPHLVLDHQAHGHNLITRLNYEVRLGHPVTALEPLVRYLLFLDEPTLPGPVVGDENYRRWFEEQGRRDPRGRSLRQFDLKTRLFKYRLSYLIYSAAFDALTEATRQKIYVRLRECLTMTDPQQVAARIPVDERQAILEILRATKTGLPSGW